MKQKNMGAIKLAKKITAGLLVAAMAVTSAGNTAVTKSAKKPALSKKTVSLKVGKTATVKVKNSNKKAKVTWKTSNAKIAKITKKSSGKNASATIKGIKEGKATIAASYKLGKSKTSLKCTVKVTGDSTKQTAAPTTGATSTPAPKATSTPAPKATATAAPTTAATETPVPTEEPKFGWVATWGTAEEKNDIDTGAMSFMPLEGTTVRQIIKVTTSGEKISLRLSNQYGKSDVNIASLHIAKQETADKSDIDTSTDTVVTVDGEESFAIPAGKTIETDGIDFKVDALENVAISMYFEETPENNITGHRGARATTYQVTGNSVSEKTLKGAKTCKSWFFLADVSLWSSPDSKAVVCFGDSITDGYGTDADYLGRKPDSYTRWGDYFAKRLQANEATKHISVINEGIGANGMLGSYPTDAGKDRFERDLLDHHGVGYCIILFGVNDLNKVPDNEVDSKYNALLTEYKKMVALCHDNDIKVYAAPILPFGTSDYYSEGSEAVRTKINDWFRSAESEVDGIIEFDKAVADPDDPKRVLEQYTHSDGLHPYDGYEVMAEAIDLKLFE